MILWKLLVLALLCAQSSQAFILEQLRTVPADGETNAGHSSAENTDSSSEHAVRRKREANAKGWLKSLFDFGKKGGLPDGPAVNYSVYQAQYPGQPYSVRRATTSDVDRVYEGVPGEVAGKWAGTGVPGTNWVKGKYGKIAEQPPVSPLTKLFGSYLPNTYFSRPNFRYPYYDRSGKGYLLYGYGKKDLYEYSVFKPLEGYF